MKVLLTIVIPTLFFLSSRLLLAVESPGETSSPRAITSQEYCSFLNASQRQESEILDLYDEKMSEGRTASILRLGSPGSYEYQPAPLASSPTQEASLSFLSKQESGLFCDWCNTSEQSKDKKWEITESPRETYADVALHSNQLHFHLKSNEALHDPSTIVETMIEPAVSTSIDLLFNELLLWGIVIAQGERAVNGHSRISTLEQTRHEHSESLSSASLKTTREEGEETESFLAKRLRTEENHGNLEGTLVEKITDLAAQKRALDIPSESTFSSNKIQKLGEGFSSSSDLQNLKNVTSAESHSNAHNDKFEAPTERAHYRLGENGWEKKTSGDASWETTTFQYPNSEISDDLRAKTRGEFLKSYNSQRITIINGRKKDFEEQLKSLQATLLNKPKKLEPDPERTKLQERKELVEKFVLLCGTAIKEQNNILKKLSEAKEPMKADDFMKMMDSPNKIEMLISAADTCDLIHTRELEKPNVQLTKISIKFFNAALLSFNKAYEELAKPENEQNKMSGDLLVKSATCYGKAAEEKIRNQHSIAELFQNAGKALSDAAKEAQKPNPNRQRIDRLIQSANLYQQSASLRQQAAEAEAACLNQKAEYLSNAGKALFWAAREARWPTNPKTSKQIIDWFTQSASLHQQAAEAKAAGQDKKAEYLGKAAAALYCAAKEVQKAAGQNKKAEYLANAGTALFWEAKERQEPNPNQQSIDGLIQSANWFQKAAEAEAAGQNKKAKYLGEAAAALYCAAKEVQKPNPNQQSIDGLIQLANLYQQLASRTAQAPDTENRALSEKFGMDMVQFHEGARDAFDDDYVGTLFNDAAQAYRSSISAEKSGDASAATSWRDIGNRYRDAAKECKDFLEENNLTPQDSRFDDFLDQSIEERPTINARLEEAIGLRNQSGKSKT